MTDLNHQGVRALIHAEETPFAAAVLRERPRHNIDGVLMLRAPEMCGS